MTDGKTAKLAHDGGEILAAVGLDPVASVHDEAAQQWERDRLERELRSFVLGAGIPMRMVRRWERDGCPELVARVLDLLGESDLVILAPKVDRTAAAGALLDHHRTAVRQGLPGRGGLWRAARAHVDLVMAAGGWGNAHAERAQVHRAEIASLLVLDRVGAEHDKTAQIIDRLLSDRWDAARPTIACSWVPPEEWAGRYPEIVAASSGQGRVVRCS